MTEKLRSSSTPELRMRYAQLWQKLQLEAGYRSEVLFTGRTQRDYDVQDMQFIYGELYRRWQAGDRQALLPGFNGVQNPAAVGTATAPRQTVAARRGGAATRRAGGAPAPQPAAQRALPPGIYYIPPSGTTAPKPAPKEKKPLVV